MVTHIARRMIATAPEWEAEPAMLDEQVLIRFGEYLYKNRAAGLGSLMYS